MPVEINKTRFLSVLEASRRLRVTPQTVRNYVKKGKLSSVQVGRSLLIAEGELRAFSSGAPTSVNLTLQK